MGNTRGWISVSLQSLGSLCSIVPISMQEVFLLNLFILLFYRKLVIILIDLFLFTVSLRTIAPLLLFISAAFLLFSFFLSFLLLNLFVWWAYQFDTDSGFGESLKDLCCLIKFCFRISIQELILLIMDKFFNHWYHVEKLNLKF